MGLIQKLKSALGLDGADSPDSGTATPRDVDVTVEREPSSESEDAVKGTDTAASAATGGDEPDVGVGAGESTTEETPIEEAEPDEGESSAESTEDDTVQTEIDGLEETSTGDTTEDATDDTPVDDADDVSASVDEEGATADADEATTADADDATTVDADEATTDDADEATTADDESAAADVPDDPVTAISGIGPAYGQRLSDAGVETVADLAAADPAELEAATDISAARIEGWIDAAEEY